MGSIGLEALFAGLSRGVINAGFVFWMVVFVYTWLVNWLEAVPASWSLNLANVEPWGGQQSGVSILITLVLCGPVLMYVFGRRAWCRHPCPIGALIRVFSRLRPGKVRPVSDECTGCGTCNQVCDMEIDVLGELQTHGEVSPSRRNGWAIEPGWCSGEPAP